MQGARCKGRLTIEFFLGVQDLGHLTWSTGRGVCVWRCSGARWYSGPAQKPKSAVRGGEFVFYLRSFQRLPEVRRLTAGNFSLLCLLSPTSPNALIHESNPRIVRGHPPAAPQPNSLWAVKRALHARSRSVCVWCTGARPIVSSVYETRRGLLRPAQLTTAIYSSF